MPAGLILPEGYPLRAGYSLTGIGFDMPGMTTPAGCR